MNKYSVVIVMIACLSAKTVTTEPNRVFQVIRHNINEVEICVSNYGKFGQNETGTTAGCWWPIGTTNAYIFGAGVWFGAIDSLTGDTLVSVGYLPFTGVSEFAPGRSGMSSGHADAIIYLYPTVWPPNPSTYPMAPQLPLSHQDSWCCFNDSDLTYHVVGDTRPIGLEVYQTVYVWDWTAIEDVVWFFLDVKNVSGTRLKDCIISMTADCDIGALSTDDLCTGIVERTYIIGTDTTVVDDMGYQWQYAAVPSGTIGFDLLQTPFDLVAGEDKDGDGIPDEFERDSVYYVNNLPPAMWDVDNDGVPDWRDASENPQYGMTAFKQFTLNAEPQFDPPRYMTLAGYNYLTGIYEPFDTLIPVAADQRFLMSSGPFDLDPDSMVTIAFAVFFAEWYGTYVTPDTALVAINDIVQDNYDMHWYLYTGVEENSESRSANTRMNVKPNPIVRNGNIQFSLSRGEHVTLKLYNALGQLAQTLFDGFKPAGVHEARLETRGLQQGIHFLILETVDNKERISLIVVR